MASGAVLDGVLTRLVPVDPARENVRAVRAWEKAGFRRVPGEAENLLMEYGFSEGHRG